MEEASIGNVKHLSKSKIYIVPETKALPCKHIELKVLKIQIYILDPSGSGLCHATLIIGCDNCIIGL